MTLLHRSRALSQGLLVLTALLVGAAASAQTVFINEFHYDDSTTGGDVGEFVEIAGPAGLDLTGWTLVLYNGNGGGTYGSTVSMTGTTIDNEQNGMGAVAFYPATIQNGAPDGFALVDPAGGVVQFLSYEGSFTATDGPANGLTSTDVGVSETNSTPPGSSLQLTGTGNNAPDFTWSGPGDDSPGDLNGMQTIDTPYGPIVTTTDDTSAPDGQCTLREAIEKVNWASQARTAARSAAGTSPPGADCVGNAGGMTTMRTATAERFGPGGDGPIITFDIPESDPGYNETTPVNQTSFENGNLRNGGNEPGVWTIETAGLPPIVADGVGIDGFSQPGASFGYEDRFRAAHGPSFGGPELGTPSVLRIQIQGPGVIPDGLVAFPPALITLSGNENVVIGLVLNGCLDACILVRPADVFSPTAARSGGPIIWPPGGSASYNSILGNFIGVRPDGVTTDGMLGAGVRLDGGDGQVRFTGIGIPAFFFENGNRTTWSRDASDGLIVPFASTNVFGGSNTAGVESDGSGASDNVVVFNLIGLGADGETEVPNDTGVLVVGNSELAIGYNAIDDNNGKGIDTAGGAGTGNDPERTAARGVSGGNRNAPIITLSNATATSVDYEITQGAPSVEYAIQIFLNEPDGDVDEGQFLIYEDFDEADGSGEASGTYEFDGELPDGFFLTATATGVSSPGAMASAGPKGGSEIGPTSEFSNAVEVGGDEGATAQFAVVQQGVSEGAGSVDLVVTLEGERDGDSDITVTLVSGDPADLGGFTAETVTVSEFAPSVTVTVPITDDTIVEPSERFVFAITTDGGVGVGDPSQTTVIVVDNDGDPVVVTVPTGDGGPRLFALPVNGVTAGDIAAASGSGGGAGGSVFRLVPGSGPGGTPGFEAVDDGYVFSAGEPVLTDVAPGSDLTFTGSAPADEVSYPGSVVDLDGTSTATNGGGTDWTVFAVGNPTGEPLDLDEIVVVGGDLSDVALIFDGASAAFEPVTIGETDYALGAFSVVILQVYGTDAEVSASTAPSPSEDPLVDNAEFQATDGETAVVLELGPGASSESTAIVDAAEPGDVFAVRLLAGGASGADLFDAVDLESAGGGVLASAGPAGTTAVFAADARAAIAPGESITIPLVVAVPEPGTYEIALANVPTAADDRPVVVEIFDGTVPTVITAGEPFTFVADASMTGAEGLRGRFSVRVSVISNVATEGDPDAASLAVFPNPTAGAATVALARASGAVRVSVYDALGRQVAQLHDGPVTADASWSVADLAPGVYVVRATGADGVWLRSFTVVR